MDVTAKSKTAGKLLQLRACTVQAIHNITNFSRKQIHMNSYEFHENSSTNSRANSRMNLCTNSCLKVML